ncbi:HAMP domain-containing sensor histidine kinase [Clostridium sp.]|uniref:sensor histidine kinase n=1 Tax=Clostridium sp. TaxID=1506 RepID=UPI0029042289|nr:HAMP domain-containing sensor histidine kinase [Clostridium sp.]MDU7259013.1 HAMP domain-containing sensor histidine kinase [Clostridium butyricum]MDU1069156.1 HAMP domain-containing sensor histidine kinase [Clostridium sp.]MDU1229420.1 HAMP domain-containing sensor histidine kinase [Clostridium sp.]MDU2677359.1 HAMP domain-containing sensor histidine kinase [Clostridium sp.]MDU3089270.1 HAMP domain-containing sensor histidine kinase [Clostridium sp.]
MATRLKRKINSYISSIYFIDILIISIITLMLFSILGDYAQVNRTQHQLAVQEIQENTQELITLIIINTIFITKIMLVIKRNPRSPKIKSNIINNVIFVLKKGFKYKETRTTLLVSIILGVITLVTYLYFLATGGYENNIFVRFFQTYPFKGSIFMIMILFLTMIYGAKKTLDISVVNEALRKVNEGNLQDDIILDGSPAIRELAHNINLIKAGYKEILEEGVRSEKLKTELISNVSHDLKTPLTSIINYVNIIKSKDITEEERSDYIEILEKKSLKLKALIEDLFEMSKINSGKLKLNKELIDILSLVHQGVGEYSSLYEEKNITFKVTCEEDAIYMALDGKMISRAIENLIINSLKYSLENTRVYIEIEKNEDYVTISMKNIANYEMDFSEEEMFERFARGDKSRNSKIEGSGLGLAITKSIVELHGGIIKIRREGDMFKIYVKLPLEE